jgi:hypothetical protein
MMVKPKQAALPALVQAPARPPVQQGRTAAEHGSQRNLANSKAVDARYRVARADPIFARHLGWRQLRPKALTNDLALLLNGPGPAPISRAEDLPRGDASARKTNLKSVLSRESQVRRQSIHPKIESQNAYAPPDGVVATLTFDPPAFPAVF